MKKLLAVLTLGAVLVACSDQATAPQGRTPATPAFDIANAPPETGIVVRSAWNDILIWSVPAAGLEVVMGADAAEFCELWDNWNGDPSPSFNSIMTWADKVLFDRALTVGKDAEAATQVWPYADGTLEGFCAMVLGGASPLATGTTRGVQFVSDIGGTGRGADLNHWSYHGLLTRPDGSQAVFAFQMHWREWAPTKVTASLR